MLNSPAGLLNYSLATGWAKPLVAFVSVHRRFSGEVSEFEKEAHFMIKIKSRGNETAEQMIRRFKKACEKEGLTKDIKRVAYYEKPSEKRRRRNRKTPRIPTGR